MTHHKKILLVLPKSSKDIVFLIHLSFLCIPRHKDHSMMLILQPKFKVYLNLTGKDNTMIQVLNEHLFIQ